MRPLDGGNGAGGGAHTRIVQPPARGRDRHAPGPGGPGPPGPSRPRASNTARLRRAAARAPCTHGPHRQSHARPPSPPLHRRAPTRPGPRAAAHADQPSAISSIARRRTSPGDPHPTRHIDHSSEPVMVQPPPDTTLENDGQNCPLECKVHVSASGATARRAVAGALDLGLGPCPRRTRGPGASDDVDAGTAADQASGEDPSAPASSGAASGLWATRAMPTMSFS